MKKTYESLRMLVEPRALKLNDVLEILDLLVFNLRVSYNINFDAKKLVDVFKDIKTLNNYMLLSDADFAKAMISHLNVSGANVNEAINDLFECDYDVFSENGLCILSFAEEKKEENLEVKIVDFLKSKDINAYANSKTIAYDFIEKMQQKLWDGILDTYLENVNTSSIYSVQKYDKEFIDSIILLPDHILLQHKQSSLYFFRENVVNWALAQELIVSENEVNVIYDKETNEVIVCFDFSI